MSSSVPHVITAVCVLTVSLYERDELADSGVVTAPAEPGGCGRVETGPANRAGHPGAKWAAAPGVGAPAASHSLR